MTATATKPRVSIGVPVYNGDRYLAATLDSLLAQTYTDFELIICDNASTDDTGHISRRYAERDPRIRYVRNKQNIGASGNYRRALELASGEYFRWANSDDLFAPEGLARCVEVLDQQPSVVLVYPKTRLIDQDGNFISEYDDELDLPMDRASVRFKQALSRIGLVNIIYGLMRTTALRHTGLLRKYPGGDIPLVAELTLYGTFWEIPEFLFFRRLHATASSSYRDNVGLTQEFFDPSTKGRFSMREWQHLGAHIRSVARAPLPPAEKLDLGAFVLHMGVWKRQTLAQELVGAVRHWLHTNGLREKMIAYLILFFALAEYA